MKSQITRSDVRFELLLCSLDENLSPVVSPVSQTVSVSVSVVGPGTIAVVSVVGISISLGLGISGPLSVSVSVSIRVTVTSIAVVQSRVGIWVSCVSVCRVDQSWVSLGLGLSISGPLSVVKSVMSVWVAIAIGSVSISIVGISIVGISLSLRLGLSVGGPLSVVSVSVMSVWVAI